MRAENRTIGSRNGIHQDTGSTMRKWGALAVLAIALGAVVQFWPEDESVTGRVEPENAPARDSPLSTPAPPASHRPVSAAPPVPAREGGARSLSAERSAITPVQIVIHAPGTARLGEIVPVTIELQATQGIRQLEFSVVYQKQILELAESSPGAFAQPGGPSGQFEEVSEGSLLVRVGAEGGVIAGAGSVATVQFRAVRRGVSPLAINGVRYVVEGRQNESNDPVAYEGTITVE